MVFHFFSTLPPELRQQIWFDFLSSELEFPAICFQHEKIGWKIWDIQPEEKAYDSSVPRNHYLGFDTKKLAPVQVESVLFSVNQEARSTAQKWLFQQNDVESYTTTGVTRPATTVFAARLRPDYDVVYVSGPTWGDFTNEAEWCYDYVDEIEPRFVDYPANVEVIAIADDMLLQKECYPELVATLEDFYGKLQELWIVCGALPNIKPLGLLNQKINPRWTLTPLGGEETYTIKTEPGLPRLSFDSAIDLFEDDDVGPCVKVGDFVDKVKAMLDEADIEERLGHLVCRAVKAVKSKVR